jgi:uncharacterized membrane protein YdbT with pleckstrin-like domain
LERKLEQERKRKREQERELERELEQERKREREQERELEQEQERELEQEQERKREQERELLGGTMIIALSIGGAILLFVLMYFAGRIYWLISDGDWGEIGENMAMGLVILILIPLTLAFISAIIYTVIKGFFPAEAL